VRWAQPDSTLLDRFNGRPAVFVTVLQKDEADAFTRCCGASKEPFRPTHVSRRPSSNPGTSPASSAAYYSDLAIALGMVVLAAPLLGVIGFSLFPAAERPQFVVRIEGAQGTTKARTDAVLRKVEAVLAKKEPIDGYASNLGSGNSQIFFNYPQRLPGPGPAELFVKLQQWQNGRSEQYLKDLEAKFQTIPGARIGVVSFSCGAVSSPPVHVKISEPHVQVLRRLSGVRKRSSQPLRTLPQAKIRPGTYGPTGGWCSIRARPALWAWRPAKSGASHTPLFAGKYVHRFHGADGDDYPVRLRLGMQDIDGTSRNVAASLERI